MGCHTWFYKKMNPQPTYDEIKAVVISNMKKGADLYQRMIDDKLSEDIKENYPEWNKEMGEKYLPIKLRMIRMVEKDLCKVAVCRRYEPSYSAMVLTIFVNGNFYTYTDDLPHDLFRIGEYPTDKLFSLEETLSFIEKNEKKISFWINWKTHLEKFWMEYPDGMIDFG